MGQGNSSHSVNLGGGTPPQGNDLPPLRFHQTRGENISLLLDGAIAKRHESFCKGIVFTNRPVMVGERVCIRLNELSFRWSGVLRIGFSAHDPANLSHLPKYACPDLTSKPGYWAKALSERHAESNAMIHYYVAGNGDVHFGVNGSDRGVFFSGVDTRQPLWAMVDLYGNCTAIELIDVRRNLNNFSSRGTPPSSNATRNHTPPPSNGRLPVSHSDQQIAALNARMNEMNLREVRHNRESEFRPMTFHGNVGRNANLNPQCTVAWRHDEEFAQGYVFSAEPVRFGERIVVQVQGTEESYIGSLAFGLTNCDPSSVAARDLPEDSDLLLDRPEYWVVSKDVANMPDVGDELSFSIKPDGAVEFSKNGNIPSTFMHVDNSLRLWAFWDVYGHTSKIRLVGSTTAPISRQGQLASVDQSRDETIVSLPDATPPADQMYSECTICYEKPVDCVLYTCGHMCMCFGCAMQQWKGRGGGFCPICRVHIRDVIKTFRS